jgi:hypothetical protein
MLRGHLQRRLRLLVLGTKAAAEDASNEAVMTINFIFGGEERKGGGGDLDVFVLVCCCSNR